MECCDSINLRFDQEKPWNGVKNPEQREATHAFLTTALNAFRQLVILLSPVLPELAQDCETFFKASLRWEDLKKPLTLQTLSPYQH